MAFREDFVWGAASSAYQTEGFPSADGGGESVWDVFCRRSGTVANGDGRLYRLRRLPPVRGGHRASGLARAYRAYRFSTSWARIDPNGDGRWNEVGAPVLRPRGGLLPCKRRYAVDDALSLGAAAGAGGKRTAGRILRRRRRFAPFAGMMAAHFAGRVSHFHHAQRAADRAQARIRGRYSRAGEAAFSSGTRFVLEKPHAGARAFLPGHPESRAGS